MIEILLVIIIWFLFLQWTRESPSWKYIKKHMNLYWRKWKEPKKEVENVSVVKLGAYRKMQ